MCRFSDGDKFKLCGIVSYGSVRCGLEGVPGVYVQVAKFFNWIKKNTDKMCPNGQECVPASQCPEIKKKIDSIILLAELDPSLKIIQEQKISSRRCDVEGIGHEARYCCANYICPTFGDMNSDRPCTFPFKFEGKTFSKCTWHGAERTETDSNDADLLKPFFNETVSLPWCSTKVDSEGNHIKGEFGLCADECPRYEERGKFNQITTLLLNLDFNGI